MSFATTIAAELRISMRQLDRLTPSLRDPEQYHVLKSEIRHRIDQACLMLEGHFDIVMPEPRPKGGSSRSKVILDTKGNVVHVDFKAKRRVSPPRRRP